jgi:hypothetical protein
MYELPPLMLTWYSSADPVEPPVPAAPVTDPKLYPAHIVLPFAGVAELSAGDTVTVPTVHVLIVLHVDAEQP